MLWAGIDTHLKMHAIEIQNDRGSGMWKGRIGNDRPGFEGLLAKLQLIEKSNNEPIGAVFMNPTGNYHAPLQAFLERNGYRVILVDPRVSEHLRKSENLGREKSDDADASILAATAIRKPNILESHNHERSTLSGITRLLESVKRNVTRINNQIKADLAAVFPEYPFYEEIDSKTSLAILEACPVPEVLRNVKIEELYQLI